MPGPLAAAGVVGAVAAFGEFRGKRLLGFSYGVQVDNRAAVCPSTVVAADGPKITLDDGRVLVVEGPAAEWLKDELAECENRVRFDPADGTLWTMRRVRFCGFDHPQSCQHVTIPLRRVDMRKYTSHSFAGARPARQVGNPPVRAK